MALPVVSMDHWQFQDRLMSSQPALRSCHGGCGQTQDKDNVQLKKCGVCARALYCSKRCQKKAWPFHKLVCRTVNKETASESPTPTTAGEPQPMNFSSLGSPPSPQALATTLQEFSEAHEWAFRSLAKAAVLLNGGIEWSQNPPQNLNFFLSHIPRERNPARAFRLISYSFTPLDDILRVASSVGDLERQEQMHKMTVDMWSRHPDYAGLLHTMFIPDGIDNCFGRYIPLFRPVRVESPNQISVLRDDDWMKKIVLENIALLSSGSINAGIPFRPVEGSGPHGMMVALPGKFVRGDNASWSWTALFSRWDDYKRGDHQYLDDLISMAPALGTSPGNTIAAFNLL